MLLEEALDILACRVDTIGGLTVTTDPMAVVVVPMALVEEDEVDFNESFGTGSLLTFRVTVFVSEADSRSGHTEARGYLSTHGVTSVTAALLAEVSGGDDLKRKVNVDIGRRESSDSYITAVFEGRAHVPGVVAT